MASKKFSRESVAYALGRELGKWLANLNLPKYDCIVPVPQHWTRRFIRRTNNSETIAEGVKQHLRIPIRRAVVRTRITEKQGILNTPARRKNVSAAFTARRQTNVSNQSMLIVDDVMTSGATVSEIAKLLNQSGAKRVDVAAIARGVGEGSGKDISE